MIKFAFVARLHTSREPSPKIEVRMGVDNMVMMVKITATPSVLEEMRKSFVMDEKKNMIGINAKIAKK